MLLAIALLGGLGLAHARAQDAVDAGVSPTALVARAEEAEGRADPVAALEAWQELVEAAPTSRLAGRARTRIAWIRARSEGDFVPLRAMMAFLATPPDARDASVIDSFEETTGAMPAGRVRAESRLAVAGEWARLGDHARAHAAWQAALDDPSAQPSERALVRESMARARMDAGDLEGALGELEDADLDAMTLHAVVTRRLRAATWVPIAYGLFAAFVLAVLALVARSGRAVDVLRSLVRAPLRLVIAVVLGFGPLAIVSWWGDDSLGAFEAFAPFSFAILALSFLAGEATEARGARLAVGVLAIVASLASAYAAVALHGEALPFA